MSFRDGKSMNYTAAVLKFKQGDIFALSVYANDIWSTTFVKDLDLHDIYFFNSKRPYFVKKSTVSTSFFNDRLHIEFATHMDASSREWQSGATPMTDHDAHLPLAVKIVLQKIQNHYYDTNHDDTSYTNMRVA